MKCKPPFYSIIQFRKAPIVCRTFGGRPRSYLSGRVAWDGLAHRLPLYYRCYSEHEREYSPGYRGAADGGGDGDDRNAHAQNHLLQIVGDADVGAGDDGVPAVRYDALSNNTPSDLPEADRNTLPADHPVRTRTCAPEPDIDSGLRPRKG